MTSGKYSQTPSSPPSPPPPQSYYHALPAEPRLGPQPQPQYVIILPNYYHPTRHHCRIWSRQIVCFALLLLLAGAVFVFWPSDPDVSIVRVHLHRVRIRTIPLISLDINLDLTVKVRNKDFFSLDYKSLTVSIGYRGKQLGFARSNHGHLRARGSSYVNATLALSGVEILGDVIPLLEDIASGEITFDTVSKIDGQLGLFFFELPLEAKVSCEINVDIHNQTIERQNCYPQ